MSKRRSQRKRKRVVPFTRMHQFIGVSSAQMDGEGEDSDSLVQVKDVARVGKFHRPSFSEGEQQTIEITLERLQNWAKTIRKMLGAGQAIPMRFQPHFSGEKAADVLDAWVEDDRLWAKVEFVDAEALDRAKKIGQVSIEWDVEYKLEGDDGEVLNDPITAIAIVDQPLVYGQQTFRNAASLYLENEPMDKVFQRIAELAGVTDPITDEATALAALDKIAEKLKAQSPPSEEVKTLETQVASLTRERDDARKKQATPITVDPDAAAMLLEGAESRIAGLITEGKITPAMGEKINKNFLRHGDNARVHVLSKRHAASLDMPSNTSMFDVLLDILKEAPAANMRTAPGSASLHGGHPDDQGGKGLDDKQYAQLRDMTWGKAKTNEGAAA